MRRASIAWLGLASLLLGCSLDAAGLGTSASGTPVDDDGATSTGSASTGPATMGTSADAESHGDSASTSSTGPAPHDTSGSGSEGTESTGSSEDTGPPPSCGGSLWWELDFSVDPTTVDVNGDLLHDWAVRDGQPFPTEALGGGVWAASPGVTLDTRPLDDFRGRTQAWVRMRATSPGGRGAVLWLNVGYEPNRFAAIFASLVLQPDGTQSLRIVHRPDGNDTVLLELSDLGSGFVEVALELDTEAETVGLWVDGVDHGTSSLGFQPRNGNQDRFATVLAWDSTAELDGVRVERCP